MAYLANGNSLTKRISSVWPHIIGDVLTYEHVFVQQQGKSKKTHKGDVVQTKTRTGPGFDHVQFLWLGFKGKWLKSFKIFNKL